MRPASPTFAIAIALTLAASGIGCGPSTRGAASVPAPELAASHVKGPEGAPLDVACTPTGPELCFNAIDDNCNGVIDEGCGVATGVVQFTVAWGENPADVDLVVTAPGHERISDANRATASGFHLDRDCPNDGCNQQNVENVYFDGFDPPRGHYEVEIKLAESSERAQRSSVTWPVKVRFGARVGSRTFGAAVELTREDDKKSFSFDL